MPNQNPPPDAVYMLDDRRLLRVGGADAFDFLQNIITNDMKLVSPQAMIFACLLSPQGQWLHDFFIMQDGDDGYLLDVEKEGYDDLLRRLMMFKLRAKVTLTPVDDMPVYASSSPPSETGPVKVYKDPRLPELGYRIYGDMAAEKKLPVREYDDFCISLAVPCATKTITTGRDVMADVNLDLLAAVAWDKGCFIGQEVAARMHHRNLVKKRLFKVTGEALEQGAALRQGAVEAGQVRQVSADGKSGLAIVKLAVLSQSGQAVTLPDGAAINIQVPSYIPS